MKTCECRNYIDWIPEESAMRKVIHLDDYRDMRPRRKASRFDIFWNVVFSVLCLSVLVVLFCH